MAVPTYHDAHGHYPPAYLTDAKGRPMHSWRVLILPYIEGDHIYKRYDFHEPWDGPNNRKLASEMPRTFAFHHEENRKGNTTTNYLAVVGPETAWPGAKTLSSKDVTDGTGTTILIVENDGAGIHWMEPRDLSFADMDFTPGSPNGVSSPYKVHSVVTLDGQVRALRKTLMPGTLRALLTARGGERIEDGEAGWEVIEDGRDRPLREP